LSDTKERVTKFPWTSYNVGPIRNIKRIQVIDQTVGSPIPTGTLVYEGDGLTIVTFRSIIDIDPTSVNPQSIYLRMSRSINFDGTDYICLHRHFRDEITMLVRAQEKWYCIPVNLAPGYMEIIERYIILE